MSPQPSLAQLRPDDIASLGLWLSAHDFHVHPAQLLAAVKLVSGSLTPLAARDLSARLAPIFSTSAKEQETFRQLYQQWLARPDVIPRPASPAPKDRAGPPRRGHLTGWAMVLFVLLCMFAVALWNGREHQTEVRVFGAKKVLHGVSLAASSAGVQVDTDGAGRTLIRYRHWKLPFFLIVTHPSHATDKVMVPVRVKVESARSVMEVQLYDKPDDLPRESPVAVQGVAKRVAVLAAPQPIRGRDMQGSDQYRIDLLSLAACITLCVVPLMWWYIESRRRRGFLERMPGGADDVARLIAGSVFSPLPAVLADLRYLSREMRRRRSIASRALDIPATLASTLRKGGQLSPVFGTRAEPDYLILVERVCNSDHQPELANEAIRVFDNQGISLERYEFEGDPRIARHAPLNGQALHTGPQSLDQLLSRYPDHRLLIFSDGDGFIDRYSGQPAAWVSRLLDWPYPVLITPAPKMFWAIREWRLSQAGLALLPFDGDGFHTLGEIFRHEKPWPGVTADALLRSRPAYLRDVDLLLDHRPLSAPALAILLRDLERDLGSDGMAWLAGCAVYPELHWGITLAVGDCVAAPVAPPMAAHAKPAYDRGRRYVQCLAQLSRLPWMRYGVMPNWLRSALLQRLAPASDLAIRGRLDHYFSALAQPSSAPNHVHEIREARPPLRNYWKDALTGMFARRPERAADITLKDRVFLKFMSGPQERMAFAASSHILHLFYRDGIPLSGPRLLPLALAACLIGVLLWQRPPIEVFSLPVYGLVREPLPSLLALEKDGSHFLSVDDSGSAQAFGLSEEPRTCRWPLKDSFVLPPQNRGANFVALRRGGASLVHVSNNCEVSTVATEFLFLRATGYSADTLTSEKADGNADRKDILCHVFTSDAMVQVGRRFVNERMLRGEAEGIACAPSGDGSRLVVATNSGRLEEFLMGGHMASFYNRSVPIPAGGSVRGLAVDRDGKTIALTKDDGSVWILYEGSVTWRAMGMLGARQPLAISDDGRTLAFANARREIDVWRLNEPAGEHAMIGIDTSGQPIVDLQQFSDEIRAVAYTLGARYGYVWRSDMSQLKEQDQVVVFIGNPKGSSFDSPQQPVAAEKARALAPRFKGAVAHEMLALFQTEFKRSGELTPRRDVNNPSMPSHVRLLLYGNSNFMRFFNNKIRQTDLPVTVGQILTETASVYSPDNPQMPEYISEPWKAAGHTGGELVLVPRSPALTGIKAAESAPATTQSLDPLVVSGLKEKARALGLKRFSDDTYYVGPGGYQPRYTQLIIPAGFVMRFDQVLRMFAPRTAVDERSVEAVAILQYLYWDQSMTQEEVNQRFGRIMRGMSVPDPDYVDLLNYIEQNGADHWSENARLKKNGEKRILQSFPADASISWADWKRRPGVFKPAQ